MTTFQAEPWSQCRDEIIACWPEHYKEAYGDDEYNPDFEAYDALAAVGQVLVVTARSSGLGGYCVSFVRPHLHQRHILWGMVDSYWLHRRMRGPRNFLRLFQSTEAAMKERGVRRIFACEKSAGLMFGRMGYHSPDRVWIKDI